MANTVIQLKKSGTPAATPSSLANGELAINYADGKLFYKAANGTILQFASGGSSDSFATVNANGTFVVADAPGDILTLNPGNNIQIIGDAVNDTITVGLKDDVTIPGILFVSASSGNEGGELRLATAVTNSVLSGPSVVIDIYQNNLRFFENGGSARGAFINLAAAAAGVGTDLLASASATDTTARTWAGSAFNKANNALANTSGITFGGDLIVSQNLSADRIFSTNNGNAENFKVGDDAWIGDFNTTNSIRIKGQQNPADGYINFGTGDAKLLGRSGTGPLTYDANTIWHAGNDGSGSTLDADLLDGQHGSYYGTATNVTSAFDKANTANITADRAFGQANLAYATANGAQTWISSAFAQANLAYAKSNSANITADSAFGLANLAYAKANTANITADFGFAQANLAYAKANTANITADAAFGKTNLAFNVANVAFSQANLSYATANGAQTWSTAAFAQANLAYSKANTANITADAAFGQANIALAVANSKFSSNGGVINGDVTISGNLSVTGNTTFINVSTYRVNDPLIYLAGNNYSSDVVDIGFVANYVNATGSNVHTGIFRDAGTKQYYVFNEYNKEPDNNVIDPAGNNFTIAILNADIKTNNLWLAGTNLQLQLATAYDKTNVSYTQANTALTTSQSAFDQANLSYAQANNSNVTADSAFNQGNTALAQANIAYTQANTSLSVAQAAFDRANTGDTFADLAWDVANTAFDQANLAYAQANTANITADLAFNLANTANITADLAFNQANTANITADAAFGKVNLAFAKANTAVNTFIQLIDTPNSYTGYANAFVTVKSDQSGLNFTNNVTISALQFEAQVAPSTPSADVMEMYLTSSGTSPNKLLSLMIKNELGEEIVVSSVIT